MRKPAQGSKTGFRLRQSYVQIPDHLLFHWVALGKLSFFSEPLSPCLESDTDRVSAWRTVGIQTTASMVTVIMLLPILADPSPLALATELASTEA